VSGTFETFPIASAFEIHHRVDAPSGLRCVDPEIASLSQEWLEFIPAASSGDPPEAWSDRARTIREHLDARILRAYGISRTANDLEILEGLLAFARD